MFKKYKNDLFRIIQENGMDPKMFEVKEEKSTRNRKLFFIMLKMSPLIFTIEDSEQDFHKFDWQYTDFKPNFPISSWIVDKGVAVLNGAFTYWIEVVVKPYIADQIEPDLWERIALQEPLVTGAKLVSEDTDFFSDDEKVRLIMSINEFRLLVLKNFNPTSDELKVIDERLEYLSDSVNRLNKFDWRSVAITTLISISTSLMLDIEKGRLLFNLFQQVFSQVLFLIP